MVNDLVFRELHAELAPSREAFDLVWTHCRIVCRIAEQLLAGQPRLDADLVRAGALLHDVGVYRLMADEHYIRHGLLGYQALRERGYPERLSRFCNHHTGVGLTADDVARQHLPLPPGDYLAETGEEELVMYADKFHSKSTPPRFVTAASYGIAVSRFGDDKAAIFTGMVDRFGEPDLESLAAEFQHPIR
ncbi:HD domain-containing protein [Actinoplanes sp. NPDC051851]|uniref:HD domain-containing protein n=1 Tax=Actinoplanes sp. NPDC051851 TaxID=3154753 RepID=UPI00341BF18E